MCILVLFVKSLFYVFPVFFFVFVFFFFVVVVVLLFFVFFCLFIKLLYACLYHLLRNIKQSKKLNK